MTNDPPRIAYLCLQVTSEGQASHAHVHEIISGLRRRGWVVDLFQPAGGVKSSGHAAIHRLLGFLLTQLRLCRSTRPDVLYVRFHFAAWPTVRLARLRKIPVVLEVNGPYLDLFLSWPITRALSKFFIWLMRDELKAATTLVAVTENLKAWLLSETRKRGIQVVPNAANADLFTPAARANAIGNQESPYAIFFGAFSPWQGIGVMLQAVQEADWPRDLNLMLIGDGLEASRVLKAQARISRLRYLGTQPYRSMPAWIAGSLMSLSPQVNDDRSKTGLYPLKVFESLACGVPVIVSDYPGMADLVRQAQCGLVIPPQDAKALAQAVSRLWKNPEERIAMGKRGRAIIEKAHNWDRRAGEIDAIIREMIALRSPRPEYITTTGKSRRI